MTGFRSLSTRLVVAMLVPLSLLMLASTWLETRTASRAMIQTGETAAANLAATVKEELQGVLRSSKSAVEALAVPLVHLPEANEATTVDVLERVVERLPLVYGSALALETVPGDAAGFATYVHRSAGGITATSLAGDAYRYREQPWFTRPLELGRGVWSDPYFDEGGGEVRMVTYSVPLELAGSRAVLTADLELGFLSEIASSSLLGRPGAVIVFDRGGRFVAHPEDGWLLERRLSELATSPGLQGLAQVPARVADEQELWLRPEDGMHEGVIGGDPGRPGRLLVLPLKEAGWGIGVYFSDDDFLADIQAATRFRLMFALALLILLASTLALVSLRSLRPLGELADRTRAIARGEFQGDTPGLQRKDEIGRLSRAFHLMQEHLQHYIEDLTRATADRERMDAELTTARLLQHALLPRERPDEEDVGVDLAATVRSARAVGGDLFNYLRLDERRLFFVIGDVSDKGVPAALFMTRANALIKGAAGRGDSPSEVLDLVNASLSEENELCMFVTLLAGILDLETGRLELASAGHDAPLYVRADGEVEWVRLENGPPVGLDEDAQFQGLVLQLDAGDALVAYTDGVTEARDAEGRLFGDERLAAALRLARGSDAASLLGTVVEAVEHYADGAEQADDLTLLVVRRPVSGSAV